jgi:cytochrome c556
VKLNLALAVIFTAISTSAIAGKAEDQQVKSRQSAYAFAGWNAGKIKSQVVEHPETYNKEQVIAAANAIAAVANSGLGALYSAGTDQATGWKKSRLKPEALQKPDELKEVAVAFNKEANELAKVAAGGDIALIKVQFGKVGEACKACHDKFRLKDE